MQDAGAATAGGNSGSREIPLEGPSRELHGILAYRLARYCCKTEADTAEGRVLVVTGHPPRTQLTAAKPSDYPHLGRPCAGRPLKRHGQRLDRYSPGWPSRRRSKPPEALLPEGDWESLMRGRGSRRLACCGVRARGLDLLQWNGRLREPRGRPPWRNSSNGGVALHGSTRMPYTVLSACHPEVPGGGCT